MSRPVYEPSLTRQDAAQAWASRQLFRRPSPQAGEVNPYVWMDHGDVGEIVPGGWREVVVNDPYDEGLIVDPDNLADFSFDLATGCITWNNPGEYVAFAHILPQGGFTAGTLMGLSMDHGLTCTNFTYRVANVNVADAITDEVRIPVSSPMWSFNPGVLNPDSVRLSVYHSDSANRFFGNIRFHVVQINSSIGTPSS